ncbi:MAG: right-handed parallel beta-helix repeat-containing protein [candidate division KSB1 bacterium]|nr:right-handed parallel beta-helix repeat-containing protein [candidate division KSB1 bacterium]MDZ7273610.1 right-handed parallel beta-helix repeat-containing protein [candidate division KSB1 bacterium]MDZ7286799.1 right-handed parallel beta-helix repeat-containing protein [candidate division KSB1 bacterium]MDZ7299844.1 right-handed parallel beta-helix repeat-containing protein [candidate division KSB1 bacterium]MDZ7307757.1 right-handed parallel beta-helix repeat-containing protein [candidat
MEYRAGHFHDGIDIQADSGTSVITCSDNMMVLSIDTVNTYQGHPDKAVFVQELDAPYRMFFYDHLQSIATGLNVNSILGAAGDEIGITNFRNHLHFNEGDDNQEVHPLRDNESLCSFSDTTRPQITNFRVHKEGQYGCDGQMPKDDAGIYNVTGRVDFLVKANDIISGPGGSNTGLFGVEYEIWDSTPTKLAGNSIYFDTTWVENQHLHFVYDTVLSNSSRYWYILTNNLTSNGYWDSQTVADGVYNLCYWAADVRFNYRDTCFAIKVANHPLTPIIQGAIEGEEQVELTFGGAGATSYRIYYDTDTGPPYQGTGADQGASPIEIAVDSTVTKTVTLTGLSNGQTYYFAVKGYNSNTDEESNYSVEVSATPNIFPPPTPENLAASLNSAGFVQLMWQENDSSTAEAAGVIIFRSQTSGSGFSAIDSVATESFTDYTVSPNVTYYYKVQAYNSAGNSSQTAQVSQLAGLSGTLTGNITWSTPGAILAGEVELPSGNSITVQAGANITAATGAGVVMKIYGVFNVNGTEASPVTFDRSGSSGNWIGIRYKANSEGTISWATIRYAQKGVWVDNEDSIVLEHCTIENFASHGVYLNGAGTTVQNCTIRDAAGGAHGVYITGTCNPSTLNTSISNAPIGIMRDTGSQACVTIDGNDISNCSNAGIRSWAQTPPSATTAFTVAAMAFACKPDRTPAFMTTIFTPTPPVFISSKASRII